MEKIKQYISFTDGVSDEEFKHFHASGVTSFISFKRLFSEGFNVDKNLRPDEKVSGVYVDSTGITFFIIKK